MTYLGRYLKRPPISASRLRHNFQGGLVTFDYLNHRNGRTESLILSTVALIEHIPDKHFKIIRYFDFLSNRRRSEMLPNIYDTLAIAPKDSPKMPVYTAMLKGYVKVDPFECILCGHRFFVLELKRRCLSWSITPWFDPKSGQFRVFVGWVYLKLRKQPEDIH